MKNLIVGIFLLISLKVIAQENFITISDKVEIGSKELDDLALNVANKIITDKKVKLCGDMKHLSYVDSYVKDYLKHFEDGERIIELKSIFSNEDSYEAGYFAGSGEFSLDGYAAGYLVGSGEYTNIDNIEFLLIEDVYKKEISKPDLDRNNLIEKTIFDIDKETTSPPVSPN